MDFGWDLPVRRYDVHWPILSCCRGLAPWINFLGLGADEVTLSKLECSKQAFALNTLAWNNTIGLWLILLVCETRVMIKRDSRGHSYFIVRGEILGFMKDELLRKHLPRMFSLIKNESWGLEDD